MELIKEGRCLVTIKKVTDILAIEGADFIEQLVIDGWDVISKKGEYSVDDLCVFFEIDSFLPISDPRFEFLASRTTQKDDNDVLRHRLRTNKLRGVVSQGLCIPVESFLDELALIAYDNENDCENMSVLEFLYETQYGIEEYINVTKYIAPAERSQNAGGGKHTPAGDFPWYVPKTDETRLQSIYNKTKEKYQDLEFMKTLKLDGSSTTIIYINDPKLFLDEDKLNLYERSYDSEMDMMVKGDIISEYPYMNEHEQTLLCSRNFVLKFVDIESNAFWKNALENDLMNKVSVYCRNNNKQYAVQGESMGSSFQGNREGFETPRFFAFKIWDITEKKYLLPEEFIKVCADMNIETVPVLGISKIFEEYPTIKDFVAASDISSINNKIAEGVCYASTTYVQNNQQVHFKVINNKFLLKCEE